jgi:MFS family permease
VQGRHNAVIYLTGLAFDVVGSSAMSLVAGIWVKTLTGSSSAAALVSVCVYAPSLLGPLGGLIADRVNQRRLLIGVDAAAAAATSTLLLVSSPGWTWLIFVVMLGYGCSLAITSPAETALFTRMFTADARARLNGAQLALQEAGRLVSPLLGAAVFTAVGGGVVGVIDSATFVIAAAATAMLVVPGDMVPAPARRGSWREQVVAGVAHLWRTPELRGATILSAAPIVVSGILVAAQYSMVTEGLHRSPAFIGVLASLLGAGSVIASLVSGRLIKRFGEQAVITAGAVNFVAATGLAGTGVLPLALAAALLAGFALPWSLLGIICLGQRLSPISLQGRVSAAITLLVFGSQPVTQAIGAALITRLDYHAIYALVAVAIVIVLAISRSGAVGPAHDDHRGGTG